VSDLVDGTRLSGFLTWFSDAASQCTPKGEEEHRTVLVPLTHVSAPV
jgi:hypothetical protein